MKCPKCAADVQAEATYCHVCGARLDESAPEPEVAEGKQAFNRVVGARQAGMDDALLEVRPSNTLAIALYQSMGFVEMGRRRGYYQADGGREDALVLKLGLVPQQPPETG